MCPVLVNFDNFSVPFFGQSAFGATAPMYYMCSPGVPGHAEPSQTHQVTFNLISRGVEDTLKVGAAPE